MSINFKRFSAMLYYSDDRLALLLLCVAEYVRIILCEIDCKPTGRGLDYNGHVSRTSSGRPCQRWDVQDPHTHEFGVQLTAGASAHSNYCRNPDRKPRGPWCFTTDPNTEWEYCYIPICPNPQPVASWILDGRHGGVDTSLLGENPVVLHGISFGPGINGEPNGAAQSPVTNSQSMIVKDPSETLRFHRSMTFVTYIYLTGNIGPIFEYIYNGNLMDFWNANSLNMLWVNSKFHISLSTGREVLTTNAWHNIALTVNHNTILVYVNDTVVMNRTGDWRLSEITENGDIHFGRRPNDPRLLRARIAYAKFYDVCLDASQLRDVRAENFACNQIVNGKCTGKCIGFNAGERCENRIAPLFVPSTHISTSLIGVNLLKITWQAIPQPDLSMRNYYHFVLWYRQTNTEEVNQSSTVYLQDTESINNTYTYLIWDLKINAEYEIIIRSVRAVGNLTDFIDSDPVFAKTRCKGYIDGLTVYKQNTSFVVSWSTDLVDIFSGCSPFSVYLHYKYQSADVWTRVMLDSLAKSHTLPAYSHDECYVKMLVVNSKGFESSTTIVSTKNSTGIMFATSNIANADVLGKTTELPDTSTLKHQYNSENGSTSKGTRILTSSQFSLTLVIGICLCCVGILALIGAIVTGVVCWKRTSHYRHGAKSAEGRKEDLNLNSISQATNYGNQDNHDEMYQEVDPSLSEGMPHYETLERHNHDRPTTN